MFIRSFELSDLSIRSGGDGRTVEAYATVFNTPSYVRDQDGEYNEEIDPDAFTRDIALRKRAQGGWNIPVIFNHGMTLFHTPSELDSGPIGVVEEIRADKKGLFTRSRYHNTQRASDVLEMIREGSVTGYSFSGVFKKSTPEVPRGGFRRARDGSLQTVRRMSSTLREFGPVTFPVYEGAEIVGVRAEQAARYLSNLAPGEADRLAQLLSSGTRSDPLEDADTFTPDTYLVDGAELVTEDQPSEALRSATPKERIAASYAAFLTRTRSA